MRLLPLFSKVFYETMLDFSDDDLNMFKSVVDTYEIERSGVKTDTSNISLSIGADAYGSNPLTITIGGISSIASVTAASDATATSNTLKTTLGTDQGQVNGASAAAKARRNATSTAAAILKASAESIESTDLAIETAKLTKNVLLNKVSLSLSAQANNINNSKLDLLG